MPPAVSRPWFVRLRSTIKSTIPRRIRISPIRGEITIIRRGTSGRWIDIKMTLASSLEDDCTAPYDDDFIEVYGPRSSPHLVDGHRIRGPFNTTPNHWTSRLRKPKSPIMTSPTTIDASHRSDAAEMSPPGSLGTWANGERSSTRLLSCSGRPNSSISARHQNSPAPERHEPGQQPEQGHRHPN